MSVVQKVSPTYTACGKSYKYFVNKLKITFQFMSDCDDIEYMSSHKNKPFYYKNKRFNNRLSKKPIAVNWKPRSITFII